LNNYILLIQNFICPKQIQLKTQTNNTGSGAKNKPKMLKLATLLNTASKEHTPAIVAITRDSRYSKTFGFELTITF